MVASFSWSNVGCGDKPQAVYIFDAIGWQADGHPALYKKRNPVRTLRLSRGSNCPRACAGQ